MRGCRRTSSCSGGPDGRLPPGLPLGPPANLVQEAAENPDVHFAFSSVAKMNDMFRGRPVLPSPGPLVQSAFRNFGLLVKSFGLKYHGIGRGEPLVV